jgi:hypothetical protein
MALLGDGFSSAVMDSRGATPSTVGKFLGCFGLFSEPQFLIEPLLVRCVNTFFEKFLEFSRTTAFLKTDRPMPIAF